MSKEAMKLALEALEYRGVGSWRKKQPAITALREALAEQQEPVAWGVDWGKAGDISCVSIIKRLPDGRIEVVAVEYAPYSYTSPPEQRKPLTDEQIDDVYFCVEGGLSAIETWREQARAIEAAHGIKENT